MHSLTMKTIVAQSVTGTFFLSSFLLNSEVPGTCSPCIAKIFNLLPGGMVLSKGNAHPQPLVGRDREGRGVHG